MPREDYEERRAAHIERLQERAEKTAKQSEATLSQAKAMADVIPFGQPILIGHHSERRDRNYREKIQRKFRNASKLHSKANELSRRAEAAESNTSISCDDPEAVRS